MIHRILAEGAGRVPARPDSIPFIGRRAELAAVTDFCRDVWEGEELAVCWVQGEAGIGKSALIEEAEKRLKGSDRIIITLRMYPHAVNSVAALAARGLNAAATVQRLLSGRTDDSLPSVLASLRRLTRLRPVVLIFEDLHLLEEGESVELRSLLEGLRNESLPVICASRIADDETYRRLLLHIRRNLEVRPLGRGDMEELANAPMLRSLHVDATQLFEASRGYPLLLQGLVTELHNAGLADPKFREAKENGPWLVNNRAALSIRGLTEAFLSGLTDEEKRRTRRLAVLGEVFSPQTAALLLGDAPSLIDRLLAKGVIVRSTTFSLPLFGPHDSAPPYRFNHTLLFEELLRETDVAQDELLRVIADAPPLYSLTIFQQLENGKPSSADPESVERAIRAICATADKQELRHSYFQNLAIRLCACAEEILRRYGNGFEPEQKELLYLEICAVSIGALKQQLLTEDRLEKLSEFDRLTRAPATRERARYRLLCLSNRLLHKDTEDASSILDEIIRMDRMFPGLRETPSFITLLGFLSTAAKLAPTPDPLLRLWGLYREILSSIDVIPVARNLYFAGSQILYVLGLKARTAGNVAETLEFGKELDNRLAPHITREYGMAMDGIRAEVFFMSGALQEVLEILRRSGVSLSTVTMGTRQHGQLLIKVLGAAGLPPNEMERIYRNYLAVTLNNFGPESSERTRSELAMSAMVTGLAMGEAAWGEHIAAVLLGDGLKNQLQDFILFGRVAATGNEAALRRFADDPCCGLLVRAALDPVAEQDTAERTAAQADELLREEICNLPGLTDLQLTLRLIDMAQRRNPESPQLLALSGLFADALRRAVAWALSHDMPGFARPFLALAQHRLPHSELSALTARTERMVEKVREKTGLSELLATAHKEEKRPRLSVIGAIAAQLQDQDRITQRFQGARVRRIIALIAANHLLLRPLSLAEFRHIATGMDPDSERTAAYTRTLLWRVRSVIGSDAIVADGDAPPRFDTEHVRVDLLEAAELLERCSASVRGNRPLHARKALAEALAIIGEGPVYPTLFDEFFEAARLDFEIRLREGVRATVGLLRREGDLEEAERLLRPALSAMPGDDELLEELTEVLALLGRNAESVALRQRSGRRMKAA